MLLILSGCQNNKQSSISNKALSSQDIQNDFFTVNATGEFCVRYFEVKKIIPGKPSLYLLNKGLEAADKYIFEIKSYDEGKDSNYFFIAKYSFKDGIKKPAKCFFVRWKNYPDEYKTFSDTTSVVTSLDYSKFKILYPSFRGKLTTVHFKEIRFSDDFQTAQANLILATFKESTKKEHRPKTDSNVFPDRYFNIPTRLLTKHPKYLYADFEFINGFWSKKENIPAGRHFFYHYNKDEAYFNIQFNEYNKVRFNNYDKDSSYIVKVKNFSDHTLKAFYIRRENHMQDLSDTVTHPNVFASNLNFTEIKSMMPQFSGKVFTENVNGITVNLDEMLSESYCIPFLVVKENNTYQDTLRFFLDCIKAKGYLSTYTKYLIEYGAGAISYDEFLAYKDKWIFSDFSDNKYLSKSGKVLNFAQLKKDAEKTANNFLNDEKSYFNNRNRVVDVTGFLK